MIAMLRRASFLVWCYLASAVAAVAPVAAQAPWTGTGVQLPAAMHGEPAAAAVPWIGLTVSDMDRSLAFYTQVLTFQVEADSEVAGTEWERLTGVFGVRIRVVRLRLGEEHLQLMEYLAASTPGRPTPVDGRSHDRWFQHVAIIVSDMDSAYRLLRAHKVRSASTEPQLLPKSIPAAAGIRAFYFKDPDGHPLEILQFPPDKGDRRWQNRPALFLGLDHTAIVVRNTERSLRFYRDLLGFQVAGTSENFGAEQEHLNNVEGARLRITSLRSPEGPGVELLEYLAPTDGRPFPADARPNDLIHWETAVLLRSLAPWEPGLAAAGARRVSRPGRGDTTGNPDRVLGVLVRDPDGHAVRLIEPLQAGEARGTPVPATR